MRSSKTRRICLAICWISFALLIVGGVLEFIHTRSFKGLPYTELCAVSAVLCCCCSDKKDKE